MQADFLDFLEDQAGVQFDLQNSLLFAAGRSGGMQALREAMDFISSGGQRIALVGGVDSYADLYLLGLLDAEDRILASGIMDGFAPGEGAGFLLVGSDDSRVLFNNQPSIRIHYPGFGIEPGHRSSDQPYSGDGLAAAFAAAMAPQNECAIQTIFSGINGENFNAKEWGVALMRNQALISPEVVIQHPAECFGDTGAAAMPLLTGLAVIGMKKNYVKGPVLISCSSEGSGRGAVCLTYEETRG
jgi:3-oxoacyl-[acyl-carrier-protein] synthase-1